MLVDDAVLEFEPLGSEIHINELYIGGNSIFKETLENLWQSGINHLTLVVEKCKASKFDKYQRRFNFGRRDGYIDVDILALNVDRVLPGTVLREIYAIVDQLDDFILVSGLDARMRQGALWAVAYAANAHLVAYALKLPDMT